MVVDIDLLNWQWNCVSCVYFEIKSRNIFYVLSLVRANESDDVMVSAAEVKRLALSIEEELFNFYNGVDTKYKHKFRTLITHLKDPKNKVLMVV